MKPFISIAIAFTGIFNPSFAGSGTPSHLIFPTTFVASLQESHFLFEHQAAKVCACQVLRVVSKNEEETSIAVFAQIISTGDLNVNVAAATSVLEKEKKHLKKFFFTKITTAGQVTAPMPCSELYKNLQANYENIKLYDVLDADALTNKLVARK